MLRRRRRPNFSLDELQVLVKAVESRSHLAEGKIFGNFESHRQAWLDVAEEVHAKTGGYIANEGAGDKSAITARTATELRLKWIDLACRVRQKWRARMDGHNVRDYPSLQLSQLEYNVLAIIKKTSTSRFKTSSRGGGRPAISSRNVSKPNGTPNIISNSNIGRLSQPQTPRNQSPSAAAATLPKVSQVRINGANARPSPLATPTNKKLVRNEITFTTLPRVRNEPVKLPTVITIADDPQVKSLENLPSSTQVIQSEFSNGQDNVFNYENGWREMAVRQDQMIELLREVVQENVRRREVEEETLNLLKTIVSLQARSVELKEYKLGFSTQREGYVIEEGAESVPDVSDISVTNSE